jgi:hypothetical protein
MGGADADFARPAWRAMSDIVLDHDRKVAVSEALGLSFARVRGLRRLATQPHTMRALAERLAAGRAAAARADAILDEPPAALRDVPAEDLAALLRVLERLAR